MRLSIIILALCTTVSAQTVINGNTVIQGGGGGGGCSTFSCLTSGTNTSAAMLVGSGGSLGTVGGGTIQATTFTGVITESQVTNLVSDLASKAAAATTVNGHALTANVTISASDLTTGTLPHAQLPALVSGDIPNNAANTTGSAAKWTTARNLAGNSVDGSANVAFANKFIVQGTTDAGLSGPQFLGALGTGIVKNTTTTGILSIAASADVTALWSGTCNSGTFLRGDGACAAAGSGVAPVSFTISSFTAAPNACYGNTGTLNTPSTTTMTGLTTANAPHWSFTSDPSTLVGWGATGGMVLNLWPTANTLNSEVCNVTASSITTSAVTVNVAP